MGWDFNVNFNSTETLPLLQFLDTNFNLKLTAGELSLLQDMVLLISAVFSKYLGNLMVIGLVVVIIIIVIVSLLTLTFNIVLQKSHRKYISYPTNNWYTKIYKQN